MSEAVHARSIRSVATQLANIETRTGRSLAQLAALVKASGLTRHGEIRALLKRISGMGYGDANSVVHYALESDGRVGRKGGSSDEVVDEIYAGPKAALRPMHDKVMAAIERLGAFEIAPKKGYLSLRRKKQFAMVGPGSKGRLEIGLNMKGMPAASGCWPRSRAACANSRSS